MVAAVADVLMSSDPSDGVQVVAGVFGCAGRQPWQCRALWAGGCVWRGGRHRATVEN